MLTRKRSPAAATGGYGARLECDDSCAHLIGELDPSISGGGCLLVGSVGGTGVAGIALVPVFFWFWDVLGFGWEELALFLVGTCLKQRRQAKEITSEVIDLFFFHNDFSKRLEPTPPMENPQLETLNSPSRS